MDKMQYLMASKQTNNVLTNVQEKARMKDKELIRRIII